jgi:hypothetical protein
MFERNLVITIFMAAVRTARISAAVVATRFSGPAAVRDLAQVNGRHSVPAQVNVPQPVGLAQASVLQVGARLRDRGLPVEAAGMRSEMFNEVA